MMLRIVLAMLLMLTTTAVQADCANPHCQCDPCLCADCNCGVYGGERPDRLSFVKLRMARRQERRKLRREQRTERRAHRGCCTC